MAFSLEADINVKLTSVSVTTLYLANSAGVRKRNCFEVAQVGNLNLPLVSFFHLGYPTRRIQEVTRS